LGQRSASVKEVAVVVDDSVTFTAGPSAASSLYFSPATASILSPAPGAPVEVVPGQPVTFTFTSAEPGSYGVDILAQGAPAPASLSAGPATDPPVLYLGLGKEFGVTFGVIMNPPGGGGML